MHKKHPHLTALLLTALLSLNVIFPAIGAISTGGGNVFGPASSTTNAISKYAGTTGKSLINSGILIDSTDAFDMPVLGSAPANPAASRRKMYWRGTTLYGLASDGTETAVGGSGSLSGSFTAGEIVFATGASALDGVSSLWWDNSNTRLGIGLNDPAYSIQTHTAGSANNRIRVSNSTTGKTAGLDLGTAGNYGFVSAPGDFAIYTNSTERWLFETGGDIVTTGAYKIGLGTQSPINEVHVHGSTPAHRFTTSTTGDTSGDGTLVGINSDGESYLWLYENKRLYIGTNNTERAAFNAGGSFELKAQNPLRLADSDSSNYIDIRSPATVGSNVTLTLPDNDGDSGQVLQTNGSGTLSWATASGGTADPGLCQFRLSPSTGVPVVSSTVNNATSIYAVPYGGNRCSLHDGASTWTSYSSAQMTLSLTGYTADKNYDVFLYNNAGTPTLEGLVWTNDSTRATGVTRQDGVWVKSGDSTRRLLGTIRIDGTGGQVDYILGGLGAGGTAASLGVANVQNTVPVRVTVGSTTNSYTYGTATWREPEASGTFRASFITPVQERPVLASYTTSGQASSGPGRIAVGYDSTSAVSTGGSIAYLPAVGVDVSATAFLGATQPAAGWHYVAALERGDGFGTQTWYGDNNDTDRYQNALEVTVHL